MELIRHHAPVGYCTHESTLSELANRTVDPLAAPLPRTASAPTPAVPLPAVPEPGSCNKYIPPFQAGAPTMQRFTWTVQYLVSMGWYVLIDYHPMGMEKTSYDAAAFVAAWENVWSEISCLPNFSRDLAGRVFIDILNEPDSQWQGWQPKDGKAGAAAVAAAAVALPERQQHLLQHVPTYLCSPAALPGGRRHD